MTKIYITLIAIISFISIETSAQKFKEPVSYMIEISTPQEELTKDVMSYTSAVAHGKSARKVEKKRKEMIQTTQSAKNKIKGLPDYNGDTEYRDAALTYFDLCLNVLKEDYEKIVDMEEIAEQSYDNMEAYMMAQEKANEKLDEAGDKVKEAQKAFAAKNNVTLMDDKSKLGEMVKKTNRVGKYHRELYLIYFKIYKQEAYLVNAIDKKDINGIEQNKNSLLNYTKEAEEKLKNIKSLEGDMGLVTSIKKTIAFCETECNKQIPQVVDFFMASDKFDETKKAMDAKKDRTNDDVNNYNKAANEMNARSAEYNKLINEMNQSRAVVINDWNNSSLNFLSRHTPKYK